MVAAQAGSIVSIVGPGRSGTTVLGEILGKVEGVFDAGELRWIWRRGLTERRRCGCGKALPDCPLWSEVLRAAGPRLPPPAEVIDLQRRIGRRSVRPRVLAGARPGSPAPDDMRRYADVMSLVYRAICEVSGARVVVDTSKRAIDAAVANRVAGDNHFLLHVVRDPRAVAYSWQRVKANPSSDEAPVLSRRTAPASAVRWVENSLSAEMLRRRIRPDRQLLVRYEDFARDPDGTIRGVLAFLGQDPAASPVSIRGVVALGRNHTVAGNPDRFRSGGDVEIREDAAWRGGLGVRDRVAVQTLTWPLLLRYGYPAGRH